MEKTCLISNYHVKKRLPLIQTFTGTGGQTWYLIVVLSSPPDLTVIEKLPLYKYIAQIAFLTLKYMFGLFLYR